MKIPTKHINTKHTFMFAGALATVVALTPAVTFAHGGGEAWDGRSSSSSTDHQGTTVSNDSRYSHGDNYDGQKWWGWISADGFQKMHEANLAKLDKIIADNALTVENGDALRADVVSKADSLKTNLTALEQLRKSIDKNAITDEQRTELKAQTLTTFESFYDYYESLYSYKAAIKVAADTKGAKVDINTEKQD
ncbi:MAG: hypothetical protein JWO61_282 [Candidatus Saccharibacteria bacterium]|nr:hypothetical protein [Candidatus Saccharibacteria bacterium]